MFFKRLSVFKAGNIFPENPSLINKIWIMFGADPDRIGLLGKPPAAEHSFTSKSQ
jgi:hypothetical protein